MEDVIEINSGKILNNATKAMSEYSIVHGCCFERAIKCNTEWGKSFSDLIIQLKSKARTQEELLSLLKEYLIQDFHWDWLRKAIVQNSDEYEWFFCDVDDVPQGACVIFHPKESKLQDGKVFYIEYIAVAPWNRSMPDQEKVFGGVGKILIQNALNISINQLKLRPGFNLHSLPQTETFYEKIGMEKIPGQEKDGMAFYEMSAPIAMEFKDG